MKGIKIIKLILSIIAGKDYKTKMFKWEIDEDGNFIQDTEGQCMNCGDWCEFRIKIYGIWACKKCAESELNND